MTSGGQCVMTSGVVLMLQWCVDNWVMHMLEVSYIIILYNKAVVPIVMLSLVLFCSVASNEVDIL